MLGRERAIHHSGPSTAGSVTQKVEEAELHWSLEKRSCGDTQREAWERHQHFYSGKRARGQRRGALHRFWCQLTCSEKNVSSPIQR